MEIFNESSILVISYTLIAFTPINESALIKYKCGWLFITVFVLNVFVNIGVILYSNAVLLILCFKKLILRIKSKLRRNKLQRGKQETALEPRARVLTVIEEKDEENQQTDQNFESDRLNKKK